MKSFAFFIGMLVNMALGVFGLSFRLGPFRCAGLDTDFLGAVLICIAVTSFACMLYVDSERK